MAKVKKKLVATVMPDPDAPLRKHRQELGIKEGALEHLNGDGFGFYMDNFLSMLERLYGFCEIDGRPAFVKYRPDEAGLRNPKDPTLPGMYQVGEDELIAMAKTFVPNLPWNKYKYLPDEARAYLAQRPWLRGNASRRDAFVDAAGQVIGINVHAQSREERVVLLGSKVDPKDRITAAQRIGAIYDPDVQYDEAGEAFLLSVAEGDPALAMLQAQAVLSAMLCDDSEIKKSAWLFGRGSNGKGMYFRIRDALFPGATLEYSMHELVGNNQGFLAGRTSYCCPELEQGPLPKAVVQLYKANTGGDDFTVPAKYARKPLPVHDLTWVVATNHKPVFPQMENVEDTMERRAVAVPFPARFADEPDASKGERKRIVGLKHQLTSDPHTKSYLLNVAIAGLHLLCERGYYQTPESKALFRDWFSNRDSVKEFIEEVGDDLTGVRWGVAHLVVAAGGQHMIVCPAWMTDDEALSASKAKVYDEASGRLVEACEVDRRRVELTAYANDINVVYRRYAAWMRSTRVGNGKGQLSLSSFSKLLQRHGLETSRQKTRLGVESGRKDVTYVLPSSSVGSGYPSYRADLRRQHGQGAACVDGSEPGVSSVAEPPYGQSAQLIYKVGTYLLASQPGVVGPSCFSGKSDLLPVVRALPEVTLEALAATMLMLIANAECTGAVSLPSNAAALAAPGGGLDVPGLPPVEG